MPKGLHSAAPFVALPAGHAPLAVSLEHGQGPNLRLDFLGHFGSRDLYFNQDLASVGLICGGLVEDIESTLKRLIASHLASDPDAQVLILYSDSSTVCRRPCPFMNLGRQNPKVLTSPRSPESASRLYSASFATAVPLSFEESAITTQHLLALCTPPHDIRDRGSIINTLQLVISQLREPFDLPRFIEIVEKETWTEDGANFMALRETVLTGVLSSQSASSLSFEQETIVDFCDPIISCTGIETVLMDMVMQQFLQGTSKRRKLVVLYDVDACLPVQSPLSRSLESLAALGRRSPTSVIVASLSPSNVSPFIYKYLDYMICGLGLFAVWEDTLRDRLSILLSKSQRSSGRLIIWSPESREGLEGGFYGDPHKESVKWNDKLATIDIDELHKTTPEQAAHQPPVTAEPGDSKRSRIDFGIPGRTEPSSPSWMLPQEQEEDGMIPLNLVKKRDSTTPEDVHGPETPDGPSTLNSPNEAESSFSSMLLRFRAARETRKASDPLLTNSPIEQPVRVSSPEWTSVESRVPLEDKYPDIFRPLVSGVLTLSDYKPGVWVDFEELRKLVGDKKTLQSLGWGTYTSYVKMSQEQKVLELKKNAGGFKAVKLMPLAVREKYAKSIDPAALAVATCPPRFRSLVSTILKASGGDVRALVRQDELVHHLGQPSEELYAFLLGGGGAPYWFQQAIDGKWIETGKFQNKITWFRLGPKKQLRSL